MHGSKRRIQLFVGVAVALGVAGSSPVAALVHLEDGARLVAGVQLLQDAFDEKAFYYLPQYPSLATKEDGTLEFLCVKYTGNAEQSQGGIFHALVEFTLPEEVRAEVERQLRREVPDAILRGPVPLMQPEDDEETGVGGFRIVSAILQNAGDESLSRQVITSGRAPLTPGSKAAVAANLTPEGATLLWETLEGPTSDVSIAISAYYEAKVAAYNAKVTAEMENVYNHFSRVKNKQGGFKKRDVRQIVDEMQQEGVLNVEVVDRSKGLSIDSSKMEEILNLITTQLTDLMFDAESGWARQETQRQAVGSNDVPGREKKGAFAAFFSSEGQQPYIRDNQLRLKSVENIRRNKFVLNLTQATTIRVPFDTSGNLGGIYSDFQDDERYFRVVNLEDPTFQRRPVHVNLDGAYAGSFKDVFNFVTLHFRKSYPDNPAITRELVFSNKDFEEGVVSKEITYPRLGLQGKNWTQYEYQVRWSVKGRADSVADPPVRGNSDEDSDANWHRSSDIALALVPPLERLVVDIDLDRDEMKENGVRTAIVEFEVPTAGKTTIKRVARLKPTDVESVQTVTVFHDRDRSVRWRVAWHGKGGRETTELQELDESYLYLTPPMLGPPAETSGTESSAQSEESE